MVKRGATRRRKMRGGDGSVTFKVVWDDQAVIDQLLSKVESEENDDGDVDFAIDELEGEALAQVDQQGLGYAEAKWTGDPLTSTITASYKGEEPSALPKLSKQTVYIGKKKMTTGATYEKVPSGGKRRKTRGRRRA